MTDELSRRDREILAFERQWWRYGEAKDVVVRDRLGLSTSEYHRALGAVIDLPSALAHDPLLVKRLRRLRGVRRRHRSDQRRTTRTSGRRNG